MKHESTNEVPEAFDHYLAAWNETDVTKIRGHFERSCTDDVFFVDPTATTRTIDELTAFAVKVRTERPNVHNRRITGVDGHNLRYRYLWEIYDNDKLVLHGMDVTTINEDGKIVQIDGFYGDFPEME
ncbi:MAG: nuclear transport factor 2 family protein [Kordiimonadaceae bacterium]|nr:nuclear transport factor 2 family protein [Kordiimonadaceae bacterium]MBO6567839.1 nuclear transport factor 2 family protein [Kordiimonadaceae bacterium]MBO6964431.1 nuclear transport factor 2 family protein [Kordiimonadaceae bacterium]